MRKVMLVEDEEFILQGLKNILDWERSIGKMGSESGGYHRD